MADSGFSYETLVASLSAIGSASGTLISLSVTGRDDKVRPLVDYGDFSQHIFLSDAVRKFNTSLRFTYFRANRPSCHTHLCNYNPSDKT